MGEKFVRAIFFIKDLHNMNFVNELKSYTDIINFITGYSFLQAQTKQTTVLWICYQYCDQNIGWMTEAQVSSLFLL